LQLDFPLRGNCNLIFPSEANSIQLKQSDTWCRCRKRHYAMSIKRLFDAVERRGDIGRRIAAFALPISNRPRVTSSCAGKIGLREPGECIRAARIWRPETMLLISELYTILETPPPVILLCQAQTYAIRWVKCERDFKADSCPLYPRKRTNGRHFGMSALCHKRT